MASGTVDHQLQSCSKSALQKQADFLDAINSGMKPPEAYIAAGYSPTSANSQSYRLLKRLESRAVAAKAQKKAEKKVSASIDRYLTKLQDIWDQKLEDLAGPARPVDVIKAIEASAKLAGLEPAKRAELQVNGQVTHQHNVSIPVTSLIQQYLQAPSSSGGIVDLADGEYERIVPDNRTLSDIKPHERDAPNGG